MPDPSPRAAIILPPKEGFSPGAVGGVGLMVHRLAAAAGHSVVIGAEPGGKPFPDVPFRPVAPGFSLLLGRNRAYAAEAARMARGIAPDLIEVHNRPEIALVVARLCAGRPVVLFLHNDPQGMRFARTRRQRRALVARLPRIVTVSEYLRARLLDGVDPPPGRVPVVLPNGLDLATLPPPVPAAEREPVILFAGRVVADKGADAFVAACARTLPGLPGWRAEMIGADRFSPDSPETPFLRNLRPEAEAAGIAMPGYRPHEEVLAAMARAAIVVMPSRWPEPFGLTALEAMASGAALICSARGALPEVAGQAALYADPDNTEELAHSIALLARDPGRRAALAAAGQERAQRFDIRHSAATLAALRREILAA
jgi:UDP-glucose:(glucosyl)LPS alpha-1,2-glucosyltransferase